MRSSPIRVGIFPFGGEENPYQRIVRENLNQQGCEVTLIERKSRLGGLEALTSLDHLDIVSCDWMTGVYRGRSLTATTAKHLRMIYDLRKIKIPMVWTVHNIDPHEPPVSRFLDWSSEQKLVARMSGFIHFSEAGRHAWNLRHPTIEQLPNVITREGNVIDEYDNTTNQVSARQRLGIDNQSTSVAICFGNIRPYKGYAHLAEKFLHTAANDTILMIVGPPFDQEEAARIQALADRDPARLRTFFERIPKDDVQVFMNAADVGITPFLTANNSSSVALMQSFGLPILMPRLGGLPEAALPWNSIIYEPGHLDQAINPAFEFGLEQRTKRLLAIEEIRLRDTWTGLATEFIHLFEEVLRHSEDDSQSTTAGSQSK